MAEGFLKAFNQQLEVYSAGTQPATQVHPKAIEVMQELGVDLSTHTPEKINAYLDKSWDYVITVCGGAKEVCPIFQGKVETQLHIGFEDPAEANGTEEEIIEQFRIIRDQILRDFFAFHLKELKN